jgi:uncharacterized damage-inducible protein DinB
MKEWKLEIHKGYNPRTQAKIGLFAEMLDQLLVDLKLQVKDLTVRQLEWQLKPGMNTIGILLAHLSYAEVWWVGVAATGLKWDPDGKKVMLKVCRIEDDGIPRPADGTHPSNLKGLTAKDYILMLNRGRRFIHTEMKTWQDKDTNKFYKLGKKAKATQSSTMFHILEHFASHFGQILMLKHMMRDAGVLKTPKKKKK